MNKVKDFFYYISDFIVSILILSIMFFLITWKLGETMPVDFDTSEKLNGQVTESKQKSEGKKVVVDAGTGTESKDKTKPKDAYDKDDTNSKDSGKDSSNTNDKDQNSGSTSPNTQDSQNTGANAGGSNSDNKPANSNETSKVNVSIESGMSGVDIAYLLEEKGVIDSADLFIAKLESMELAGSLLAGEFELEKNMSYENAAKALTGQ